MENIAKIFKNSRVYKFQKADFLLGENKIDGNLDASLVVFYTNTEDEKQRAENKAFLLKMLGAVKHNEENTLIVNDNTGIKFNQLSQLGTIDKVLFFGTTRKALGLNLNLKRYKLETLSGIQCLFVDSIERLKDDKQRKSALWTLMKKMFDIA